MAGTCRRYTIVVFNIGTAPVRVLNSISPGIDSSGSSLVAVSSVGISARIPCYTVLCIVSQIREAPDREVLMYIPRCSHIKIHSASYTLQYSPCTV